MTLPLSIRFRTSRYAAAAFVVVHGLALAAVASSRLGAPLCALLSTALVASCIVCLRRHALRSTGRAIVACVLRHDGEVELSVRDGTSIAGVLDGSSTVSPWLVVLCLRDGRRLHSVMLLPDMMDNETWRRLAVVLRAHGNGARSVQPK